MTSPKRGNARSTGGKRKSIKEPVTFVATIDTVP